MNVGENDRRMEKQQKNNGDHDGHQQTGEMEHKQEIDGNNEASTG